MKQRKKFLLNVLFLFMLLAFIGCGKENQENSQEEPQNGETINIEENGNGIVLFSTKYDVEDYCQGCFIVSKNDGLLYGVLDKEGKEILPVEYDNIEFLNDENVKNGTDKILFMKTQYEDEYKVFDANGKEILDSEVSYIEFELPKGNSDPVFFEHTSENILRWYDEKGKLLLEIEKDPKTEIVIYQLTKDYFLMLEYKVSIIGYGTASQENLGIFLYNMSGDAVYSLKKGDLILPMHLENESVIFYLAEESGLCSKWSLDMDGQINELGELSKEEVENEISHYIVEDSNKSNSEEYYLGPEKNIHLYSTNSTWKLEDKNGNPLYDNRYYECTEVDNSYFLSNEDNQVCVIDKNGEKIIDYGRITRVDDDFYFDDNIMQRENYFVGDDGVCYVHDGEVEFFPAS